MSSKQVRPGADACDDDDYLIGAGVGGTGALHSVREVDPDSDDEPSLWLPMSRSAARLGGWYRQPVAQRRPMGFRRP